MNSDEDARRARRRAAAAGPREDEVQQVPGQLDIDEALTPAPEAGAQVEVPSEALELVAEVGEAFEQVRASAVLRGAEAEDTMRRRREQAFVDEVVGVEVLVDEAAAAGARIRAAREARTPPVTASVTASVPPSVPPSVPAPPAGAGVIDRDRFAELLRQPRKRARRGLQPLYVRVPLTLHDALMAYAEDHDSDARGVVELLVAELTGVPVDGEAGR